MKQLILSEIFRILSLIDETEENGWGTSSLWDWVEFFNRKYEWLC